MQWHFHCKYQILSWFWMPLALYHTNQADNIFHIFEEDTKEYRLELLERDSIEGKKGYVG